MRKQMRKNIIMVLMLIIAFQACYIQSAYAGSLGITVYGDFVEGEKINIYWNTGIAGADHYDCTVLNTTTGKYAQERTTSGSGYECYLSGSRITAGHYKIWVGAVAANGDVLVDEYKYFTVNEKEECEHRWSSSTGKCRDCGARCSHNNTYETCYKQTVKTISDTQHKSTYYYNRVCQVCDYIVEEDSNIETRTQQHDFNTNGDCRNCDYRVACQHRSASFKIYTEEYANRNESEHKVTEHYVKYCQDCDEWLDKTVSYNTKIEVRYESHSYNSKGVCRYCDYVKPSRRDPLSVSVKAGQSEASVGASISASCTASGGSGSYQYSWKVKRDGSTVYSTDASFGSSYSYVTNKAGKWTFTVTVIDSDTNEQVSKTTGSITVTSVSCTHPNMNPGPSHSPIYKSLGDIEHECKMEKNMVCADCGYTKSSTSTFNESHVFANGKCKLCGAAQPACAHQYKKHIINTSYDLNARTDEKHTIIETYYQACSLCGVRTSEKTETKTQNHSFANPSYEAAHPHKIFKKCTACGYAVYTGGTRTVDSCAQCPKSDTQLPDVNVPDVNVPDADSKIEEFTTVQRGSSDKEMVIEIQKLLNKAGYSVAVDGHFGSKTLEAVKAFQKANGINVTGVVGEATWKRLLSKAGSPEEKTSSEQETVLPDESNDEKQATKEPSHCLNVIEIHSDEQHTSKLLDGEQALISKGDKAIVQIFNTDTNEIVDYNNSNLYLAANNGCTINGLICTFENAGTVTIRLIRKSDNSTLATAEVFVTTLEVEDNGFYYDDYSTTIVQMKDMENVDWKHDSVYVTDNVVINDFVYSGDKVNFEAYNNNPMIYAVVSYDEYGNEIDRSYVGGYDASSGIIDDAAQTFWATERIFDTKAGNDQSTAQTNIELKTKNGGYIRILQPSEDEDLLILNCVESCIRIIDVIDSSVDAVKSFDLGDASAIVKAIDKRTLVEIGKQVMAELSKDPAGNVVDLYKALLTDQELLLSFKDGIVEGIANSAIKVGHEMGLQVANVTEDVIMQSNPVTWAMNKAIHGLQVLVDTDEFGELTNSIKECLDGKTMVRIHAIEIP